MPAYHLPAELDLADVVVQTQSTVVEEARQRLTLVDEVVHGLRERRLVDELRTLHGDPVVELGEDGFRKHTSTLGVRDATVRVGRRVMGIVQHADEANSNHGALAVHRKRVKETSARVRPATDLDDAGLAAIHLMIDARSVSDHVATESSKQLHRHTAIVLLGVAEQYVPVLRHDDPEMAAATLLYREDQDAGCIDRQPSRVFTCVLPHRLRDGLEQRRAALDQIGKCGARQMHP